MTNFVKPTKTKIVQDDRTSLIKRFRAVHLDCSVDRLRYAQLERIFRKSESFKLESPKSESFRSSWKKPSDVRYSSEIEKFRCSWKVPLKLES